jgi:isopentenyldiphosphate isomerase
LSLNLGADTMKNKKLPCACCGELNVKMRNNFEICPICNWQDDAVQNDEPDYDGGANHISLNQAKEAHKNKMTNNSIAGNKRPLILQNKNGYLYECPCCKKHKFNFNGDHSICPVCNWQNDLIQNKNPDEADCANYMSLNQARKAYSKGEKVR